MNKHNVFMEKQIQRLAPPGGRDKPTRNSANLILHQFEANLLSEEAKLLDKGTCNLKQST